METIFKLNLEDQVCSNLATQGAFETSAAGLRLAGEARPALLTDKGPHVGTSVSLIPYTQ